LPDLAPRSRPTWLTFFRSLVGREGSGPLLSLIAAVAIGWLAVTHRLQLYVHPRYFTFTVAMTSIASVFVVLKLLMGSGAGGHGHSAPDNRPGVRSVVLAFLSCVALLIAPPAALTSTTAKQREINSVALRPPTTSSTVLRGADSNFDIRDWVSVLEMGASAKSLSGKRFDEVGFVAPVRGRESAFSIARFLVTCCTLDAVPIGVTVLDPGWSSHLAEGQWVRVQGTFESDPAHPGVPVVAPRTVQVVHEPSSPYEY
jgi:uncharacterized repeat protein (TIGR03943 family)